MSAAEYRDSQSINTAVVAFVRAVEPDEPEEKTEPAGNPWADEEATIPVARCLSCKGSGMVGHETVVRGRPQHWTVMCESCEGSGEAVAS